MEVGLLAGPVRTLGGRHGWPMPCHNADERGGAWDLIDAKVNYYRVISA